MGLIVQMLIGFLGASLGSFAAVVIFRIPERISWVHVRSFCPQCQKPIKPWHNIPVVSYLMLWGKCAGCDYRIPLRGFFLELLFLVFALGIYWQSGLSTLFIIKMLFFMLAIVILYIDMDHLFIPVSMLFFLWVLGGFYLLHNAFLYEDKNVCIEGLLCAFVGFFSLALLNVVMTYILRKRGRLNPSEWAMGWGDPWLLGGLALFIEPLSLSWLVVLASSLGIFYGLSAKVMGGLKVTHEVPSMALPFGSFLCLSAIFFFIF